MAQQLIVIVNKLNKRSAIPSDLSDKRTVIGVVGKGFQFEGIEVTGVANAAPGRWYQDRDGFFYWGKGLANVLPDIFLAAGHMIELKTSPVPPNQNPQILQISQAPQISQASQIPQASQIGSDLTIPSIPETKRAGIDAKMSWAHDYLHIPQIWKDYRTAGKDVVVALIDTGVHVSHQDLNEVLLPQSISIDASGNIDDHSELALRLEDPSGHGTAMAGILAASGKNQVYGIAPECRLLVIKVMDSLTMIPPIAVNTAFKWLNSQTLVKVDIILFGFALDQDHDDLRKNVQACLDKGMAVFAPIGDTHLAARNDADVYPACYTDCTAIGSFGPSGELCSFSNWNTRLSLIAPGDQQILTTTTGNSLAKGYFPAKGYSLAKGGQTGIAAAVAAGSFALLVSYRKLFQGSSYSGRSADYLQDLYLSAEPLLKFLPGEEAASPVTGRDPMYGYGRLNLQNALAALKTNLP